MKTIIRLIIVLLLLYLLMPFLFMAPMVKATIDPGKRMIWVGYWDMYTEDAVDEDIALAKAMNIDALITSTYDTGMAMYDSSIVPQWPDIDPGFDPLDYAITQCHANNMKLYARISVYYCASYTQLEGEGYPEGHIAEEHPGWITHLIDGGHINDNVWLDPGVPAVKDYIVSIVEEIVQNYNVDGVVVDYIRYNYAYDGYADLAIAQFQEDTGYKGIPPIGLNCPEFMAWKEDQVTDMVSRIKQEIESENPNCLFGAATWDDPVNGLRYFQQDAYAWMEEGLLDFAVPMTYTTDNYQWEDWVNNYLANAHGCPVLPAISVMDFVPAEDPEGMVEQMKLGMNLGCIGETLFALNHIADIVDPEEKQTFIDAIKSCPNIAGSKGTVVIQSSVNIFSFLDYGPSPATHIVTAEGITWVFYFENSDYEADNEDTWPGNLTYKCSLDGYQTPIPFSQFEGDPNLYFTVEYDGIHLQIVVAEHSTSGETLYSTLWYIMATPNGDGSLDFATDTWQLVDAIEDGIFANLSVAVEPATDNPFIMTYEYTAGDALYWVYSSEYGNGTWSEDISQTVDADVNQAWPNCKVTSFTHDDWGGLLFWWLDENSGAYDLDTQWLAWAEDAWNWEEPVQTYNPGADMVYSVDSVWAGDYIYLVYEQEDGEDWTYNWTSYDLSNLEWTWPGVGGELDTVSAVVYFTILTVDNTYIYLDNANTPSEPFSPTTIYQYAADWTDDDGNITWSEPVAIYEDTNDSPDPEWPWQIDTLSVNDYQPEPILYQLNDGHPDTVWLMLDVEDVDLEVETLTPTKVTYESAVFNGRIISGVGISEYGFEYKITGIGSDYLYKTGTFGTGTYSLPAQDLIADTIYEVRFYAVLEGSPTYGEWKKFLTQVAPYSVTETGAGLAPPVPTTQPSGWYIAPDWGYFHNIPWTFICYILLVALVVLTGILITAFTKHLGILFCILGLLLGIFCFWPNGGYLPWWTLFPFILVGWALITKEQQYGW